MIKNNNYIRFFNPSTDRTDDDKTTIYHYTSPEGLKGILHNASIRFTDCAFLNDKSEFTHIKTPLEKALRELKGELRNDFETYLDKILEADFEAGDHDFCYEENSKDAINFIKRYYVFCASTAADSLGMWNYYVKGGNYQGYNIGFKISNLLECFSKIDDPEVNIIYGKVIYREKDQVSVLKDKILKADQDLEDKLRMAKNEEERRVSCQESIDDTIKYIENYRLFFKDEAFSNEKEFRFIIKLSTDYISGTRLPISFDYNLKNGIFTPYCEVAIEKTNTLSTINLSPMMDSDLAKQGLKRYLKQNGYNNRISIGQSKVPIVINRRALP